MKEYQWAIVFSVLAAAMLFISGKARPVSYIAVLLVLGFSFLFPLAGMLLFIPILFNIYLDNQSGLKLFWERVKNVKIEIPYKGGSK